MTHSAKEMGLHIVTEVYGLFAAAIPQAGRQQLAGLPARKRHGLVPDFLTRLRTGPSQEEVEYLGELKVVHLSRSWYKPSDRYEAGQRKIPVSRRARQLPRDYVRKAQKADQQYCGTRPGTVGPVEARLRTFTHVVPLVFGAFGEVSEGVELLLSKIAAAGAKRHWRRMKARKEEEAIGALVWLLRRRWGMTAVRENARLTLDRLQYVGSNPRSKGEREFQAVANAESRCRSRADALEFSSMGPSLADSRPAVATRWA